MCAHPTSRQRLFCLWALGEDRQNLPAFIRAVAVLVAPPKQPPDTTKIMIINIRKVQSALQRTERVPLPRGWGKPLRIPLLFHLLVLDFYIGFYFVYFVHPLRQHWQLTLQYILILLSKQTS